MHGTSRAWPCVVWFSRSFITNQRRATLLMGGLLAVMVQLACNAPVRERTKQAPPGPPSHSVTILSPSNAGGVVITGPGPNAKKLRVACDTCHSLRSPRVPHSTEQLDQFHKGLRVRHGELACTSCHDATRPQSLRLASGERVAGRDVVRLCAQCHGPQKRDYDHGAHGGMTGYWDLSRGPRTRKSCVHCHAPHLPAYVGGRPVLPPRDLHRGNEGVSR